MTTHSAIIHRRCCPCRALLQHGLRLLSLLAFLGLSLLAVAEVRLAHLFSDDMVLQREKPVPVWGTAAPGERVTVQFAGQSVSALAGADGKWLLRLRPLRASHEPREMLVTGRNEVRVRNVVVGDVWLCSGDFGVYYGLLGCNDAEKEIAAAHYPLLRLLKVESRSSNAPRDDFDGAWKVCSPETAVDASALAFFFGRTLLKEVRVPIGLIDASYRYSVIQSWVSPEGFHMIPELKVPRDIMDSWDSTTPIGREAFLATFDKVEAWLPGAERAFRAGTPVPEQPVPPAPLPPIDSNYWSLGELSNLYHGMITPLMPFAIRGVVWSMGESGSGRMDWNNYHAFMRGLVEGWRKSWGQGNFPVYFELLPSVGSVSEIPGAGGPWARFREEQAKGLSIPNTGMAVTFDVSDYVADRRNRLDAGVRLARWALNGEYGRKLESGGPLYRSHRIEGDRVIITFDHIGRGLMAGMKDGQEAVREAKDGHIRQFALAGADKKWYQADALIAGKTVVVHSDKVPVPVAVRYAYADHPTGNLYNRDGLPAAPFRTDAW